MHRRPHRIDVKATKAAHFLSKFSYVSLRIHPGTNHQCVYLAGDDCGVRRRDVFARDSYRCVDCGGNINWEIGQLAHGGSTKVSRCWCFENLRTKCYACHMVKEHGRFPRFGEVNA